MEDLTKFETLFNTVKVIVNNLKNGDKRKSGALSTLTVFDENLKKYQTAVPQILQAKDSNQRLINEIYINFINDNENKIKLKKRDESLEKTYLNYLVGVQNDSTKAQQLEFNAHEDLQCRIKYMTELKKTLESDVPLNKLARSGSLCKSAIYISHQLSRLSIFSKPIDLKTSFGNQLKKLLG